MQQSVRNSHNEQPSIEEPCKFKIQTCRCLEKGYARPPAGPPPPESRLSWAARPLRLSQWPHCLVAAARWTHRQAEFDWCQLHLVHRRLTVSHASSMARALSESDPGLGAGGAAQARVMYTCSGCGISFDKKRGFDAHRSHRFARPLCRGGFEQAERLSLAVTMWHLVISECVDDTVRGQHRPKMQAGV